MEEAKQYPAEALEDCILINQNGIAQWLYWRAETNALFSS